MDGEQRIRVVPAGQAGPGPARKPGVGHPGQGNDHLVLGLGQQSGQTQGQIERHVGLAQPRPDRPGIRAAMTLLRYSNSRYSM